MAVRFAGFPILAEFLQGAVWKATGTIIATTLINSISLGVFLIAAARAWNLSLPILAFGIMSVPLVVLHSFSSYIDLFCASMVCFQVLAASMLDRHRHNAYLQKEFLLWSGVYVLSAAAVGNSKLLLAPVPIAISAFLILCSMLPPRNATRQFRTAILIITAVATLLSLATNIRNAYEFGNLIYPIDLNVPWLGIHLVGPEAALAEYPFRTAWLGLFGRPINWFLSVTELEWVLDGIWPDFYYLDLRHAPYRMGGYWGALIVGTVFLLLTFFAVTRARDKKALHPYNFTLGLFLFLTPITSFLPQSHELRYYLYWPMMLFVSLCMLVKIYQPRPAVRLLVTLLYLVTFIYSEQFLGFPLRVFPIITQASLVTRVDNSQVISLARWVGKICLGRQFSPIQFMYSSVFHEGQYVIVQGSDGCNETNEIAHF